MTKYCPHCYKKNEFSGVAGKDCLYCKKSFISAFKNPAPNTIPNVNFPTDTESSAKSVRPQPSYKPAPVVKKSFQEMEEEEFTDGSNLDYNETKARLLQAISEDDILIDGENNNARISNLDGRYHPRGERLQRPIQ